jgi:hypothetical protein
MTKGTEWAAAVRDAYVLNEAQDATVDVIADTLDAIQSLPAREVVERRQQRVVLLRALGALALPDADGETSTATVSAKARKAARVRWDRQRGA